MTIGPFHQSRQIEQGAAPTACSSFFRRLLSDIYDSKYGRGGSSRLVGLAQTTSEINPSRRCRPQFEQRSGSCGAGGSVSSLMTTGPFHQSRQMVHGTILAARSNFFTRLMRVMYKSPFPKTAWDMGS